MKLIQHVNGVVVDIRNAREDATISNIALVDNIPAFEPKDGYNGVLKYGENGLYWDYEEAPANDEISGDEFMNMVGEVL